jgi:hypothetical protein
VRARGRTRRWLGGRGGGRVPGGSGGGAEDGGGDAHAGRGARVAGLVFAVGDLGGDRRELSGDRGFAGGEAFVAVEDLVVLAAALRQHPDDVLHAAALDVGDVGLHEPAGVAGPC